MKGGALDDAAFDLSAVEHRAAAHREAQDARGGRRPASSGIDPAATRLGRQ